MELQECIDRIERYIGKDDNRPRIINFNSREDLYHFKTHFKINGYSFKKAEEFCSEDENIKLEEVFNYLDYACESVLFLEHFSGQLRVRSSSALKYFIKEIINNYFKSKVVLLCYLSEDLIPKHDTRKDEIIYYVVGERSVLPKIYLVNEDDILGQDCIQGIHLIGKAIENSVQECVYVQTHKTLSLLSDAAYNLEEYSYKNESLKKFPAMRILEEKQDDSFCWKKFWSLSERYSSLDRYFADELGLNNRADYIERWSKYDRYKKIIALLSWNIYSMEEEPYLYRCFKGVFNPDVFEDNVFNNFIDEDVNDKCFIDKYRARKTYIKYMFLDSPEILECKAKKYCNFLSIKDNSLIFFLTDLTLTEQTEIFRYLNKFGIESNYDKVMQILGNVFPNLCYYLKDYPLGCDFYTQYFKEYKYQKVLNKIFDNFHEKVLREASKRSYNTLKTRDARVEELAQNDTIVFFIDALGVEFLGFLSYLSCKLKLNMKVDICRCELPSLTSFNTNFLEVFEHFGSYIYENKRGIKRLDDLKHHGSSYKAEGIGNLPVYITQELAVLEDIFKQIEVELKEGKYKRAVIISDHGASRLAVINNKENKWEMTQKGKHAGRCCLVSDLDTAPDTATEENNYYVLANYDRFKGGRKADIEVHGGATLEEVLVPIIELTTYVEIDVYLETKQLIIDRTKRVPLKLIFSLSKELSGVYAIISGKKYESNFLNGSAFEIILNDWKKVGDFSMNLYDLNGNLIKKGIEFNVRNSGIKKKSLF